MSENDNELQTKPHTMQKDIKELQLKYDKLSKEVKELESNKAALGSDMKNIKAEFEGVNKSIEDILQKLNSISDKFSEVGTKAHEEKVRTHSIRDYFSNSLKKIAVGTLSAVYSVADKTIETTSSFKESLEDIAAEAQYANKKRRMPPLENS